MKNTSNEEQPAAAVRIENRMLHALDVPIPGPGKSILRMVRIEKATPKGPGIYEGTDFDALTLNRLRYHYEWRPTDTKLFGKPREGIPPDQIAEIGLLKITVLKPGESKARSDSPGRAELR
jgi:hypothetical protein